MPGLDGAQTTRALLAASPRHARHLPDRLGHARRSAELVLDGRRGRLPDEGREPRRDRRGDPRRRPRGSAAVELTAANTAIVLDSTADFPAGAGALPELARRPALRQLRRRELPRLRRPRPRRVLRAARPTRPRRRRPPSRRPATSSPSTRSSPRATSGSSRCRSHSTLSGTFASAEAAAAASPGDAVRVIDTRTVSAAVAMLALRGSAPARARHERRGDRRARRALPRDARAPVHRRHARVPRPRRPDRPRRRASPARC